MFPEAFRGLPFHFFSLRPTVPNSIIALGCFIACIFFSAVSESLRNFLRSRLAFVCRVYQNEERFGIILRDDEAALRASESVRFIALALALMLEGYSRFSGPAVVTSLILWSEAAFAMVVVWLFVWVFPWTISRVAAESILFHCWPIIQGLVKVTTPFQFLSDRIDTFVHRMAGRQDPSPENLETLTEEIQSVVDEGEREGILETRAGKMVYRVMELRQEDVRAVMTPRTDIVTIQADCTLEEARRQLLAAGHSRVPVVENSADDIIGILYARDLLEYLGDGKSVSSIREIVREAFYVPETNTIDALLDRMKQERLHLAIVLDEYGGVTGLVTLEDILEEIVGDIADEFDEFEDERIEWIDAHTMIVDARMHIDEINDLFDLGLPEDLDFDTLGGLVFSELERVPKEGERFEWNGIQFTVLEATERKINRIQLYSPVSWPQADQNTSTEQQETDGNDRTFRLVREEPEAEEQAT